jgi:pimeloyl-ACP methyl ester carboxylesterase
MLLNHHRAGSGDPLVLMHGIGSHWQVWEPVLPMLTARHDVIAVDLPGFGDSPMPPPGTPPGIDSLCDLVLGFLADLGIERPHVAGNSLGGGRPAPRAPSPPPASSVRSRSAWSAARCGSRCG